MNDYQDRLEKLATRGSPIGVTALLDRVDADLDDTTALTRRPARQIPAWMAATAAFAFVLIIGGVWAVLSRPAADPNQTTDSAGITWIDVTRDSGATAAVFAGPGGFARLLFGGGEEGIQFSADGTSWADADFGDGPRWLGAVTSSRTHWLVTSTDDSLTRGWLSTDGLTWSEVSWPSGLEFSVSTATAIDSGLFATTRDVFGPGTQHWVSPDGQTWVEVDPVAAGVEEPELLRFTTAGLVDIPRVPTEDPEIEILISSDGVDWLASRIPLPQSYRGERVRWGLDTIERLDAGWVAVGRIEGLFDDPVVHVWTSGDGQNWVAAGVPPFGEVPDRAVGVFYRAASAGFLAIAPATTPAAPDRDGFISGAGFSERTGELWTTANGMSWTLSQSSTDRFATFAVGEAGDGSSVGLFGTQPHSLTQPEVVETTVAPDRPQLKVDPAGIELQAEIVADGVVTEDEFIEALDGWKGCMEGFGIEQVEYEIDRRGGWGSSYVSNDDVLADAADVACRTSFIEQVTALLNG